jgi:hypothetical protein
VENSFEDDLDDLLRAHYNIRLTDIRWDHCRPGEIRQMEDTYSDLRAKFIEKYQPQEP